MPVSALYHCEAFAVIRRQEQEIRESQELSEAYGGGEEGENTFMATGVQEVSACGQKI